MTFLTDLQNQYHQREEINLSVAYFPIYRMKQQYLPPPRPQFQTQPKFKLTQVKKKLPLPISSQSYENFLKRSNNLELPDQYQDDFSEQKQPKTRYNVEKFDGLGLLKLLQGGTKNEANEQTKAFLTVSKQNVRNSYESWRRANKNQKNAYIENTFKILNKQ